MSEGCLVLPVTNPQCHHRRFARAQALSIISPRVWCTLEIVKASVSAAKKSRMQVVLGYIPTARDHKRPGILSIHTRQFSHAAKSRLMTQYTICATINYMSLVARCSCLLLLQAERQDSWLRLHGAALRHACSLLKSNYHPRVLPGVLSFCHGALAVAHRER